VEEAGRDAFDADCVGCVERVIKDGRLVGNADRAALVRCRFDVRKVVLSTLISTSGSVTCLYFRNSQLLMRCIDMPQLRLC
jgi:hypothetical protein